eukprot:359504-Chlamydomonas_euryale.AAC.1
MLAAGMPMTAHALLQRCGITGCQRVWVGGWQKSTNCSIPAVRSCSVLCEAGGSVECMGTRSVHTRTCPDAPPRPQT